MLVKKIVNFKSNAGMSSDRRVDEHFGFIYGDKYYFYSIKTGRRFTIDTKPILSHLITNDENLVWLENNKNKNLLLFDCNTEAILKTIEIPDGYRYWNSLLTCKRDDLIGVRNRKKNAFFRVGLDSVIFEFEKNHDLEYFLKSNLLIMYPKRIGDELQVEEINIENKDIEISQYSVTDGIGYKFLGQFESQNFFYINYDLTKLLFFAKGNEFPVQFPVLKKDSYFYGCYQHENSLYFINFDDKKVLLRTFNDEGKLLSCIETSLPSKVMKRRSGDIDKIDTFIHDGYMLVRGWAISLVSGEAGECSFPGGLDIVNDNFVLSPSGLFIGQWNDYDDDEVQTISIGTFGDHPIKKFDFSVLQN